MNKQIVYGFAEAISEHNLDKISSLMTDDHTFIDAHGEENAGKEKMKKNWAGYFKWFPDYTIEITDIFENGNTFAAFGFASGTFKGKQTGSNENHWRLPASWKVIVENNKIKLWQVFTDTKIPFDIVEKNK